MALTEKEVDRISSLYADLTTVNQMLAESTRQSTTWDLSAVQARGDVPYSITIPKLSAVGVLETMRKTIRDELKKAGCAV